MSWSGLFQKAAALDQIGFDSDGDTVGKRKYVEGAEESEVFADNSGTVGDFASSSKKKQKKEGKAGMAGTASSEFASSSTTATITTACAVALSASSASASGAPLLVEEAPPGSTSGGRLSKTERKKLKKEAKTKAAAKNQSGKGGV